MTKNDLKSYKYILQEVEQITDKIETLRGVMYSPKNQIITGMPRGSGGTGDKIGDLVSRAEVLINKYVGLLNILLREQEKIENVLATLECQERLIVRYRYLDGDTWGDIADKIGCSIDNVYKKHGKIIQKISKTS